MSDFFPHFYDERISFASGKIYVLKMLGDNMTRFRMNVDQLTV